MFILHIFSIIEKLIEKLNDNYMTKGQENCSFIIFQHHDKGFTIINISRERKHL